VITTVQGLNECDTRLQMIQKEGEGESAGMVCEASPGEAPDSQVLHTVFVRHGLLVADHF